MATQKKKVADFSKYQGQPDYNKVSEDVDALVIRVQYGSNVEDSAHKYDESMCKQFGIPFSSYAYGQYVSVNDAIKESDDFMARADKETKTLFLDAEEVTTYDKSAYFDATQAFINNLKKSGKKVGLYTGEYFFKAHGFDKLTGIDVYWIAKYNQNDGQEATEPSVPYQIWQYTSKGVVQGVNGNVDLSDVNANADLDWFFGIEPKPAPAPHPKPVPQVHFVNYKVKHGDTLWDIAQHYHIPLANLIKANSKYADLLPVGVTIKIPLSGPAPAPKKHVPSLPSSVLNYGDKGQSVSDLQYFLNKLNFIPHGDKSGVFGKGTKDALERFQSVYLPHEVDGVYGPHTKSAMQRAL